MISDYIITYQASKICDLRCKRTENAAFFVVRELGKTSTFVVDRRVHSVTYSFVCSLLKLSVRLESLAFANSKGL
jgi:hypothetical protein